MRLLGRVSGLASSAMLVLGCGPAMPLVGDVGLGPAKGDSMDARAETHGLGDREHLLFQPRGNPTKLLGLAVTRSKDGKWLIADELVPACKVQPRSTPERWNRTYVDDLKSVVAGGAEFGEVAKLKAKYGDEARVEVTIQNTERLDADFQGDCGERIILSVSVGTGVRFVMTRTERDAAGGAKVLGIGAQTAMSQDHDQSIAFSWDEPEAWAFAVGRGNGRGRMELNAVMPTELVDGQAYRITVIPNRDVWLLVYFREENGQVGKLLPDEDNPTIQVTPHERRDLPQLRAGLTNPTQATQENMVVCGFDSPDYARDFAPPRGDPSPAQMQEWYKGLPDRLQQIGRRHYACDEIAYRIRPVARIP